MIKRLGFLSMIALLLPALLMSCSGSVKSELESLKPKANEIRKEYRKGPFCVRLLVDKDTMSIAETLDLTLEADFQEGFEAELPKVEEKLGDFGIKDYREDSQMLTAQGRIITRTSYTLEPFLSGEYKIASMPVRFRDKAHIDSGGSSWEHEISTEEITIKVNSLLDQDQKDLALYPIKGPVSLPSGAFYPQVLIGLGIAAILSGGAILLMMRRKAAGKQPPSSAINAHELAYGELKAIIDEKLVERGLIKLFFSKVSDVLRTYIENRFGLQARKRTTEEFLSDISRDAPFSSEQSALLMEFLQECDLVKFAEHRASPEQISKAINSSRAFIEATKNDAEDSLA